MKFRKKELPNNQTSDFYKTLKNLPPLKNSPKVTHALGRTLPRLREAEETIIDGNNAIFREHFGDIPEAKPDHPNWGAYQKSKRAYEKVVSEVEFMEFPWSAFDEQKNELSAAQMEWLLFMCKDESEAE